MAVRAPLASLHAKDEVSALHRGRRRTNAVAGPFLDLQTVGELLPSAEVDEVAGVAVRRSLAHAALRVLAAVGGGSRSRFDLAVGRLPILPRLLRGGLDGVLLQTKGSVIIVVIIVASVVAAVVVVVAAATVVVPTPSSSTTTPVPTILSLAQKSGGRRTMMDRSSLCCRSQAQQGGQRSLDQHPESMASRSVSS